MIIATDICPKSGLKREIEYIEYLDDIVNKRISFICSVKYYNTNTNEFLGNNILDLSNNPYKFVLSNDNVLDGIGEYDYWKGPLNDFNSLLNKGFTSIDSYISYMVIKTYFNNKQIN